MRSVSGCCLLVEPPLSYSFYVTAGTMRYAELNPGIPASMFSQGAVRNQATIQQSGVAREGSRNTTTVHTGIAKPRAAQKPTEDDLLDEGVNDEDMMEIGEHA